MNIKEISKQKKTMLGIKLFLYIIGFTICIFGGVNFMASIFIFISGFLLGKYIEKILTFIKDYRLAQKLNKISYTQIEIENLKKELDRYRQYFHSAPAPARPTTAEERRAGVGQKIPFDFDEVSYNPSEV